jgi:drug/metabolite transporter (DMT)-like permease
VAIAEQWVASGLVAIAVAAIPLWTALFTGLLMQWPSRGEWFALFLGLGGILLLNLEGDFRANPLGAVVMIGGPVAWGLDTVLAARMRLPRGLMVPATEMLTGGLLMLALGQLFGERIAVFPAFRPSAALLYLIFFPSLMGFSCHAYLITRVRPVVANSFAYMNPIVAVFLGIMLGGETFSLIALGAMVVILGSLVLLARSRQRPARPDAAAAETAG